MAGCSRRGGFPGAARATTAPGHPLQALDRIVAEHPDQVQGAVDVARGGDLDQHAGPTGVKERDPGQIEHEMIPPGAHQAGVQLLGSQQIEFPVNSDDEHVQAGVIDVQAQLWARVGIVVHLVVHLCVSLVER